MQVYLNGQYMEETQATVSIDDRGFLFADGVYEVVHIYRGRPFEWERHLARLHRSLAGINLTGVSDQELTQARDHLMSGVTAATAIRHEAQWSEPASRRPRRG